MLVKVGFQLQREGLEDADTWEDITASEALELCHWEDLWRAVREVRSTPGSDWHEPLVVSTLTNALVRVFLWEE